MAEAKRVQQYGFSDDELNRAKAALLAGYERAYKERETSESASYANEYVRHFLQQEPIPGMEFEYKIAATYLPTITAEEVAALAKELITEENRVVLGVAPEKKDTPPPSTDTLRAAIDARRHRAGRALGGSDGGTRARREAARAGQGRVAPHGPGDRRHRADALERRRGVAQADRLQERSDPVLGLRARRRVARARAELQERQPRHGDGRRRRHGRTQPRRSQQDAVRQDRAGVAVDRRIPRRASAARARRRISRPRCSSITWPTRRRT